MLVLLLLLLPPSLAPLLLRCAALLNCIQLCSACSAAAATSPLLPPSATACGSHSTQDAPMQWQGMQIVHLNLMETPV